MYRIKTEGKIFVVQKKKMLFWRNIEYFLSEIRAEEYIEKMKEKEK